MTSTKEDEAFEKAVRENGFDKPGYLSGGEKVWMRKGFSLAWQAAQSVPVVGEPTDAAYKWLIAHGVEPMASLHKLGKRLAGLLDEDQFAECELLLSKAITEINAFVPVPAAELATLREKAAMADELRKDAERYRWIRDKSHSLETRQYDKGIVNGPSCYHEVEGIRELKYEGALDAAIDAAIAQGKGE